MKTATVRDLRNQFAKLSRWIEDGQEVEITRRGVALAKLIPLNRSSAKKIKRPDFAERRKALLGDKVLPGNSVLLMREGSEW